MRLLTALSLSAALFLAWPVRAESYRLIVSRVEDDRYLTTSGHLVVTRFCHEYARREDAILEWSGHGGRLHFSGGGSMCEVESLLARAALEPGRYQVTVSRLDLDHYIAPRVGLVILTSRCRVNARRDDAVLDLVGDPGEIYFLDDQAACDIMGVWSEVR